MSRRRWLLTSLLCLLAVSPAAAQDCDAWPEPFGGDPTSADARRLARDKFEATQADPPALLRARLDAARAGYRKAHETFLAGKGQAAAVLQWSVRLLAAERDLGGAKVSTPAALGAHWLRVWEVERVLASKHEAGSVPLATYIEARSLRLLIQADWLRATRGQMTLPAGAGAAGLGDEGTDDRMLARAAFEAAQSDPRALALLRLRGERAALTESWKFMEAGKLPAEQAFAAVVRVLHARRAAEARGEDAAYFAWVWESAYFVHRLMRLKHEVGSISLSQLVDAAYIRHDAEFRWAMARAASGKQPGEVGGIELLVYPDDFAQYLDWPDTRENAKAKFEAMQTGSGAAARACLEAARTAFAERLNEFLAGKAPVALVLEWLPRLVEAERAVRGEKVNLLALLAERWALARQVEYVEQAKSEAGSSPLTSYLLARFSRLDAELAWRRAATRAK